MTRVNSGSSVSEVCIKLEMYILFELNYIDYYIIVLNFKSLRVNRVLRDYQEIIAHLSSFQIPRWNHIRHK